MTEPQDTQAGWDYGLLTPDTVLDALESAGLEPEAALLPLNSYENRVYRFDTVDGDRLVAKFYRPQRWSDAQILEEHRFSADLTDAEIPIIGPLTLAGKTLNEFRGYRFTVFPCRGGRAPELGDAETLRWLGRFIARIHLVGSRQPFEHRPAISVDSLGTDSLDFLRKDQSVPPHLEEAYFTVAEQVLEAARRVFREVGNPDSIRLHGDCHPGNILWTPDGPHFVDLDDSRQGPAIQDLWMLLADEDSADAWRQSPLMEGYYQFRELDYREWRLIEPLRALRALHYSAWLARRWSDPAFPHNFPWFGSDRYWEEQILNLKELLFRVMES